MAKRLWKKGETSPNPNGRPKGSQNKALKTFREMIAERVKIDDVLQDLKNVAQPLEQIWK